MAAEPTEQQLIEEALAAAKNTSKSAQLRADALTALRYLIEPIDNAVNLPKSGGVRILADLIANDEDPVIVAKAEYALGTASSNNPTIQEAALSELNLMSSLIKNSKSKHNEVSEKALYVILALVSSNGGGQQQFHSKGGIAALNELLSKTLSTKQLRKVLNIVSDLADVEGATEAYQELGSKKLMKALLEKLQHPDHDTKERAYLALISLARQNVSGQALRNVGGLKCVQQANKQSQALLIDADDDYQSIIEDLLVLGSDLEDLLQEAAPDRTEL